MTPERIKELRRYLAGYQHVPFGGPGELPTLLDIAERFARLRDLIEPLRALEAAATDAPWSLVTCGGDRFKIPALCHWDEPDASGYSNWVPIAWFTSDDGEAEADNIEPNRNFIAAARNALPALLREIQETA